MAEKCIRAVANQVHRGLVASDEQRCGRNDQFGFAQPVLLIMGDQQLAEQVGT